MKYKVLYRKYRPNNFENIIGQDYIIKTLKNSIINNNISHAYIFSGPRGTGKTTTAKVFSKAINCSNPVDGSPCEKCEFCTNFHENPDIIEIDAASNNGVDEIRNLIDNIKLTPTNGKYKVYIIDEVHMLTTSAFNALLLTLEGPPAHSIFILATTNIESVPITILSRCQRFDFQKITIDDIVKRLSEICKLENIDIEDDALTEIAYLSEGGMRDALSLLDQLSKSGDKITLEFIENNIKSISLKNVKELLDIVENNNATKCIEIINDYRTRGVDYKTLVKKLIDVASKRAKKIKLTNKYTRLNFQEYKDLILELSDSISKININVDSFTILEMILLNYIDSNEISEVINKSTNVVASPEATDNEEVVEPTNNTEIAEFNQDIIDIRINNCFVGAQKSCLATAKKELIDLNNSVNIPGEVKAILTDSMVVAASTDHLILTIQNEHSVDKANKMLPNIEKTIEKEINKKYKLIFISPKRWQDEKEKYVKNLKDKYEYRYIEEKEKEFDKTLLNDVFNLDKVEII